MTPINTALLNHLNYIFGVCFAQTTLLGSGKGLKACYNIAIQFWLPSWRLLEALLDADRQKAQGKNKLAGVKFLETGHTYSFSFYVKAFFKNLEKSRCRRSSANSISQWLQKKLKCLYTIKGLERVKNFTNQMKYAHLQLNKMYHPWFLIQKHSIAYPVISLIWHFEKQCRRARATRVEIPSLKCDPEKFS